MNAVTFLFLLSGFSVLTGLVTEAVKKIVSDKANLSYNLVALVAALIIGVGGCFVYYQLNDISIGTNDVIYAVLMGFASALSSQIGYDKIRQCIEQLTAKKEA